MVFRPLDVFLFSKRVFILPVLLSESFLGSINELCTYFSFVSLTTHTNR